MSWFGTIGPALTLACALAVLLAGVLARVPAPTLAVAIAVGVVVSRAADLHRPRLVLSIVEDLPALFVAAAAATLVVVIADPSLARFGVVCFACLVLAHSLVYAGTHLLRRRGLLGRQLLVIGIGAEARRIAEALLSRPELGLRPVGFVGTGPATTDRARGLPLALLGPVSLLPRIMAETPVGAVLVALPGPAGESEIAALEGLLATPTDVYAVPAWFPAAYARARHPRELVDGVPIVLLHRRGTWRPVRVLKRLVEVLVALVTLLALLPLFTVLAILVRIETGGVLVRRTRGVEHGRPVSVPSFRTRRARSVARPGTTFSVAISGRIGPVGRVLRRTRLLALPELVWALLRRLRYPGGVAGGQEGTSASAPRTDEAQVDAGQLAR